ncbi:MAG TPA: ABC transporter substrate-binding protein [Stellaceae bacterium]|nr:ABC transporter substrate-binding protein [Stellaceae bacterium]
MRRSAAQLTRRAVQIATVAAILFPLRPAAVIAAAPVVVASKIDTEGALLGSMILAVLAAHHIPVRNRLQLGPTDIVRAAILAGQIDIYPEYTGNGALFFHMETNPVWKSRKEGYAEIARLDRERNHLVWLAPAPANNTWVIAVRRDLAQRGHLATMSDFARYVDGGGAIKLAASAEFVESPAALPAFEKSYGFRLSDRQLLTLSGGNTSATLRAAAAGMSGVDAAMAYGTDGAIAALGLVALADDKGAQIVYAPAPVIRQAVLARYPQIAALLDPVFAGLTLATLQRLNAEITVDGEDAATVTAAYLKSRRAPP